MLGKRCFLRQGLVIWLSRLYVAQGGPELPILLSLLLKCSAIVPGSPYPLWVSQCFSEKGSKAPSLPPDSSKLDERDQKSIMKGSGGRGGVCGRKPGSEAHHLSSGLEQECWPFSSGSSLHSCLGQPNGGMMELRLLKRIA